MARKGKYADVEWNYFLEDLRNERIEGIDYEKLYDSRLKFQLIMMDSEITDQLEKRKQFLIKTFREYRSMNNDCSMKAWVEELVKKNAALCKKSEDKEERIRWHNAMVYKYMTKNIYPDPVIARKLGISEDTFYSDMRKVLDEMMVLAFGIDGIQFQNEIKENTV